MSLRDVLKGPGILLLDGATGTRLTARGLPPGGAQNIRNPDVVRDVHESYVRAGSRIIITNTLTDNRIFLQSHGAGEEVAPINRAGAALARSAAGTGVFVLGDMSSTGQLLEPYGDFTEVQLITAYKEQARLLAEGFVDGFIAETFIDLHEAVCALRACREAAVLPVLVTISFHTLRNGGRTAMGNSAEDCARTLTREGADAIGVNCGDLDPFEVAELIARFRDASDVPLVAQPNAGKPRIADGKTLFDLEPARFAEGLARCVENGARLIGGCCGTGPGHIAAAAKLLLER